MGAVVATHTDDRVVAAVGGGGCPVDLRTGTKAAAATTLPENKNDDDDNHHHNDNKVPTGTLIVIIWVFNEFGARGMM